MVIKYNLRDKPYHPLKGAIKMNDDVTLYHIGYNLHSCSIKWLHAAKSHKESYDDATINILTSLKDLPAKTWQNFCEAAGPTVYGAVGLSWCRDAVFTDVVKMWLASGFILKPLPEYERPARFVNPAMLGDGINFTAILGWVNDCKFQDYFSYDLAICMKIASLEGPLVLDMPFENAKKAPPQIAAFLKSRMVQQKQQHTAEEAELIKIWDAAIKGSPYDVWEGP